VNERTGGKAKSLLSRLVNNVIVLMLIVNVVNEDKPEEVLLSEVTEDVAVEQVLLVNGEEVDVNNANADVVNDVNVDVNEDNPEQILLTVVTEDVDVEQVLLVNVDRVKEKTLRPRRTWTGTPRPWRTRTQTTAMRLGTRTRPRCAH
jgi:hypothetical protein